MTRLSIVQPACSKSICVSCAEVTSAEAAPEVTFTVGSLLSRGGIQASGGETAVNLRKQSHIRRTCLGGKPSWRCVPKWCVVRPTRSARLLCCSCAARQASSNVAPSSDSRLLLPMTSPIVLVARNRQLDPRSMLRSSPFPPALLFAPHGSSQGQLMFRGEGPSKHSHFSANCCTTITFKAQMRIMIPAASLSAPSDTRAASGPPPFRTDALARMLLTDGRL
jgi:hypothetical protein